MNFLKNTNVDLFGKAVIQAGTEVIGFKAFDGNKRLRHISVPSSVKKIGTRAFADCANLETAELAEGLETVEGNAFTGCTSLKKLVLPDSVREADGWAFYRFTGLLEPIYNRSQTILYAYPCMAEKREFVVPDHVKEINPAAFLMNPYLEELIFPEGIQILKRRTVIECALKKVVIPKSVKRVEAAAFMKCQNLKKVLILSSDTVIEQGAFYRCAPDLEIVTPQKLRPDERLHLAGGTLLARVRFQDPDKDHSADPRFLEYARKCAEGDAWAMWEFADYFMSLGEADFYRCTANFWKYRAAIKECTAAKEWLEQWLKENPGKHLPAVMDETMTGEFQGKVLYDMGFLFFDRERTYGIGSRDSDGIVLVHSWSSEDGPDEDGFGREEYYDWWYLDENLCAIPGVGMMHDYSFREKRQSEEMFRRLREKAVRNKPLHE